MEFFLIYCGDDHFSLHWAQTYHTFIRGEHMWVYKILKKQYRSKKLQDG
jgi:hypothetical protein